MKRARKRINWLSLIIIIILVIILFKIYNSENNNVGVDNSLTLIEEDLSTPIYDIDKNKEIIVDFIDVGQGDSCLIVTNNNDLILIDAGDDKEAKAIIDDLDQYEFEDIDLMILTHPDSDHISGAQTILENYKVNEVLMSSFVKTTKLFTNLLTTLDSQNIKVTQAKLGLEYDIDDVHFIVVGVDTIPKDCNSSSIVTRMSYYNNSILFTGDAEKDAEEIILNNGYNLNSDILKIGHHGSDTSSSADFLKVVDPDIAIISVGRDNKYNHPSRITLDNLNRLGIKYYRTDELGTIKIKMNGSSILVN